MPTHFLRFLFCAAVFGFSISAHADTVRVGRGALPPSLGVPFTAVGPPSSEVWSALFDGLTRIDAQGTLQPALALSWANTTPTIWRFKLRAGVTFHDGTPFNAAAAISTFDLLRSPANAKFYVASEVRNVIATRRIDDLTLEIETRTPDAVLPRRLNMIYIVSPTAWAALGEAGFALKPSGTGPYRVADWGRNTSVTKLVAVPTSWRVPKSEAIALYNIPEPVRRVQALLAGQIDIAARLGPDEVRQLPSSGYRVQTLAKSQIIAIVFRVVGNEKSPIADVRVREALNLAIDREGLAQTVFDGSVQSANQGSAPQTQGFDPKLEPIGYNPARAKQLLSEAGYAAGFKMRITVFVGQVASDELVYQNVAQSIRALGVDVELRTIPFASWLQNFVSNAWGDADAFSMVWDSGGTYDAGRWIDFSSCAKEHPFFCDPGAMPEVAAVAAEMNPAKRLVRLQALSGKIRQAYPAMWILTVTDRSAMREGVMGFDLVHTGLRYESLSLK